MTKDLGCTPGQQIDESALPFDRPPDQPPAEAECLEERRNAAAGIGRRFQHEVAQQFRRILDHRIIVGQPIGIALRKFTDRLPPSIPTMRQQQAAIVIDRPKIGNGTFDDFETVPRQLQIPNDLWVEQTYGVRGNRITISGMKLLGHRRTADNHVLFQHDDVEPARSQIGGAGQTVVASADNRDIMVGGSHVRVLTWNLRWGNCKHVEALLFAYRSCKLAARQSSEICMSKPHALIATPVGNYILERVAAEFETHELYAADDRDALVAGVADKIEAICFGGHGMKIDDDFMARFPNLKIVANFGVGYDNVDARAAAARGVIVTNTPDVLTEEVADTAIGLLLMTARELGKAEAWLRAGKWASDGDYRLTPMTLRDRSVGIVGLGRIGKAIARRCEAFGLPISYFGRRKQEGVAYPFHDDVKALAAAVDTLILVTPATPETTNLINREVLEALGDRGILINIARGAVVDETALIQALRDKTIAAAGLDVMWNEPKINTELMELDNAVLLPHVGSASQHTRNAMGQLVVDNMVAYKTRSAPISPVPETPFTRW